MINVFVQLHCPRSVQIPLEYTHSLRHSTQQTVPEYMNGACASNLEDWWGVSLVIILRCYSSGVHLVLPKLIFIVPPITLFGPLLVISAVRLISPTSRPTPHSHRRRFPSSVTKSWFASFLLFPSNSWMSRTNSPVIKQTGIQSKQKCENSILLALDLVHLYPASKRKTCNQADEA
jgi:hypothetical protein